MKSNKEHFAELAKKYDDCLVDCYNRHIDMLAGKFESLSKKEISQIVVETINSGRFDVLLIKANIKAYYKQRRADGWSKEQCVRKLRLMYPHITDGYIYRLAWRKKIK